MEQTENVLKVTVNYAIEANKAGRPWITANHGVRDPSRCTEGSLLGPVGWDTWNRVIGVRK